MWAKIFKHIQTSSAVIIPNKYHDLISDTIKTITSGYTIQKFFMLG